MDLGLDFDDSDFETKQKPRVGPLTSYNARTCSPLWFEKSAGGGDEELLAQRLKFSGDYHYHAENYEAAASKYRQLLGLIHENNTSMRQDVEESLCRCYMKLRQHTESLQLAKKLVEMMKTEDEARQRQTLILYAQVCRCAGDWKGCVCALEQLAGQQSHYAQFWLQLGQAYHQLEFSQACQQQQQREKAQHHSTYRYARIVTCYVRARLLLESVLNTVGQMARERNEKTIQEIEKEISQLGVSQDLTDYAIQVMRTDIERQDFTGPVGDSDDRQPGDGGDSGVSFTQYTVFTACCLNDRLSVTLCEEYGRG
ncbi:hypothetical protein BaRGS_00018397 [Batillaria attramentaria]|uniref:Uncharacterized protein n=1 Tax=Batillaria attramentaria TaxID=370345 RepID=A0ABD0KT73_9CAEN